MRALVLAACIAATPALAQQTPRDGDVRLTAEELAQLTVGQMWEFYTGGLARYGPDGGYDYRYETDGPPAPGTYELRDGGLICIAFHNGFDRCDLVVRSGDRVVMIIKNGERYPVKAITALN